MKLEYTPQAINDLKRLHDFVADKHPVAARRIALEIRERQKSSKRFH
ncbi:type II toxin-antitoxin system RelE/ParE family toxin [Thalassolituus maritimus]